MALAYNHKHRKHFYRCTNCKQISDRSEWELAKAKYRCPLCHMLCSPPQLSQLWVEIFARGRTRVDFIGQ